VYRHRRLLAAITMITLAIGGLTLPALMSTASAAPVLPAGFALDSVATGQAAGDLTGFVELPTGGAITIGKCGKVTFVPAGGTPRQLAAVPAACIQDLGLVGVALPPDFSTSRRVYTFYSYLGSGGLRYARLSYWLLNNVSQPTTMTSEHVVPLGQVVENGPGLSHGPGSVLFGPDGTIYLGLGDAAAYTVVDPNADRAQDPSSPYGKILHIDTAGNGVPANPHFDPVHPATWSSRVFAMGVRNPFRFTIHPTDGHLYIGDVGWVSWEEHNVGVPGSNFGWPCYEGTGRTPGYQTTSFCATQYAANVRHDDPLYAYPHNGVSSAAVGGVFTGSNSLYPAAYRGAYFVGDYARRTITVLRPDGHDHLTAPAEAFGSNIGAPVDFQIDPASGDVVYADIISGNLVRIKYAAGNRAPVAVAVQDKGRSNPSQRVVAFDGSKSHDPDGDPLTYTWNFGDGQSGIGVAPVHKYATGAQVTVTLTVSDGRATGTATLKVWPGDAPAPVTATSTPSSGHVVLVAGSDAGTSSEPATATEATSLAQTGFSAWRWAIVGGMLLAVGAALLGAGKRQARGRHTQLH
jgi:glucose/arabinose dehydrogenase